MSAPQNPQAFPHLQPRDPSFSYSENGMTLRDWFATHAPEPPSTWWGGGGPNCAGRAMWNYQYADAMLAAREGGAA